MRFFVITSLMALMITLAGARSADKKPATNKDKIVGAWKLTKTTALAFDQFIFTLTNDGKFTVDNENAFELVKGIYEVDGDTIKLTPTVVRGDRDNKKAAINVKIKAISDKEIVVEAKWQDKTETAHFARMAIPAGARETAEADKKNLQGKWEHLGTEVDGKLVKGKDGWGIVEFKDDNIILGMGDKKEKVNYLLNATRKLKALQFNGENDLNLFAYELNGDSFRICQAPAGEFPKEFKTKGTNNRIEAFKRLK